MKLKSAFWAIAIALAITIGLIPTAKAELRAQATAAHPASPTGIERLDHLQASIRAAREQHAWRAYLGSARQQSEFLNGAPPSRLELARADVHISNERAALAELAAYIRMGQSSDAIESLADFEALRKAPAFAAIRRSILKNRAPVAHSSLAFRLSDPRLLAEDIDYDAQRRRFFITSVLQHKIVSVDNRGNVTDFAAAPDDWPMLGLKIDERRQLLWATEVAMNGFDARSYSSRPHGDAYVIATQIAKSLNLPHP